MILLSRVIMLECAMLLNCFIKKINTKKYFNLTQHFEKLHSQFSSAVRETGHLIHLCGRGNVGTQTKDNILRIVPKTCFSQVQNILT